MKLTDIKKYFRDGELKDGYELIIDDQEYHYYHVFHDGTVWLRSKDDERDEYTIRLESFDTDIVQCSVVLNRVKRTLIFEQKY